MSVQFGRWNTDGKPVDRDYFEKVKPVIAPYGPDDGGSYTKADINILYCAFHTTMESRCEVQPHVTESGAVITWDGRLDNRADLIRQLPRVLTIGSTDVEIVARAYEHWKHDCFSMLIGDWALSMWDANSRSLILAKDPIGIRNLYYSIENGHVTWSTILDPLVLFAGRSFLLNEEYIAGWFSLFPAANLTPYVGIHSVPPSCSVAIRAKSCTVNKYWDFNPSKRIRYHTDAEYEVHFRTVFAEAVRRRLRSYRPILAELSGGIDSSSIVCMADTIIARNRTETPGLDTVSFYDDSEPNWNERPYFTKVEEKRGRKGCHIDVGEQESFKCQIAHDPFSVTPGSTRYPNEATRQFVAWMISRGNRVVLSGIGGDEVTGGVPTPTPELEDLLASCQFRTLAHQLKVWALAKRQPWLHLLFEATRSFFPPGLFREPKHKRPPNWLNPIFVKRHRAALKGYQSRLTFFGPLPSFQDNLSTLETLRRQLSCSNLSSDPPFEKRYPYLDRELLEFMYAVPREQLVRPGQRRSLMRRALVEIVPAEILNRKRKAFIARGPMASISAQWEQLIEMKHSMASEALKVIDSQCFFDSLQRGMQGQNASSVHLMRTFCIERWLRSFQSWSHSTQDITGRSVSPSKAIT